MARGEAFKRVLVLAGPLLIYLPMYHYVALQALVALGFAYTGAAATLLGLMIVGEETSIDAVTWGLLAASLMPLPFLVKAIGAVAPPPTSIDPDYEILHFVRGDQGNLGYWYGLILGTLAWGTVPYLPRGPFRLLRLLIGTTVAWYILVKHIMPEGPIVTVSLGVAGVLVVSFLIYILRLKGRWGTLGLAAFLGGITNFAIAALLAVNSPEIVLNFWLTLGILLASLAWLFLVIVLF